MHYGAIANVSAANLKQHMRIRHGDVGALLGTEKAPGRLALAGDWADKSKHRRSTGADGSGTHDTGSAWND
ncbi:unnamed protein product, partial [Ectocarpus sp. 8 AP-2014]